MVPTNIPHAVADSGQQVLLLLILGILDQLCSSAVFCRVDGPVRPVRFSHTFVGADAHIGPTSIPEMSRIEIDAVCPKMRVVHSSEP